MKIRHLFTIAATMLTPTLLSSCGLSPKDIENVIESSRSGFRDSKTWGKVIEKSIDVTSEVKALSLNGGMDIKFTQSDSTSIIITGNEKAIEANDFIIDDSKLSIDRKPKYSKVKNIPSLTIYISAPCINDIVINGAGNIDFKSDYAIDSSFNICINGAGDIDLKKIECKSMKILINGAGNFNAKDISCKDKAEFIINGGGDIDTKIKAQTINTNISGAGDADLDVDCNELYTSISGAGDIDIKGKCNIFHKSESNFGSINSKGLQYKTKR